MKSTFLYQVQYDLFLPIMSPKGTAFLGAIASRGRHVADIEEGHISTASCILSNMARKVGRTLTWDPATARIAGDEEANQLLARPYRAPWVHPGG